MAETITYSAASGMQAAMMEITNRTNNLGNVNSTAYQAMQIDTRDLFYTQIQRAGIQESQDIGERPIGVQIGNGVKVTGTYRNIGQGTLKQTNDPMHMAVLGSGYFAVTMPNNVTGYTRAGNFKVNKDRQLVTPEGFALLDGIVIPQNVELNDVNIAEDGTVTANGGAIAIGAIQLYEFANEQGLDQVGGGYYVENLTSGQGQGAQPGTQGYGTLLQRSIELSNVKIADEFAGFMAAQQAYDMCSRMLRAVNDMLKELD